MIMTKPPQWMPPLVGERTGRKSWSASDVHFYAIAAVEAYKASLKPWMREVEPGKFVAYYRLDGETK
jgi:hypothetical protein